MKMTFPVLALLVLLVGAGGGIAFGGGVLYGRGSAPQSKAATSAAAVVPAGAAPSALAVVRGGTPGAGGAGRGGGGGGGTGGAVDSISGTTLTVRTQQGTLQTVNLMPDTRVLATTSVATSDLKPGTPVLVIGQPDANGAINATTITLQQTTSPLPPVGAPGATPSTPGQPPAGQQAPAGQRGGAGRQRSSPTPAAP
ncbi:MAG: hypothetical protein ACYDCQ_21790 [Dehalococcoidia bacterium]